MWLARLLYKYLKPRFLSLEKFLAAEIRKEKQAEQFQLAEQKLADLRKRRKSGTDTKVKIFDFNKSVCRHLKGGSSRNQGSYKDYAVRFHTYADGSTDVVCLICLKKWTPEDKDWSVALEMVEHSSNTKTSSELVFIVDK